MVSGSFEDMQTWSDAGAGAGTGARSGQQGARSSGGKGGGAHEGLSGFEKLVKKHVKLVAKIACHCNTQTKERLEAGKGRQIKRKSQATKKRKKGPWASPVCEGGHGQCLA